MPKLTKENLRSFLPTLQIGDDETAEKLVLLSDAAFEFLVVILENCPDNDERDQAFAAAKLARMWANESLLAGPLSLTDEASTTIAERPVVPS